jgi:Nuclease subunit of the excinuclease complex
MTGYVYRAFDSSGRLLYVGCSVNVESRLRYHEQHSRWWLFHERVESEKFPTRALAAEAEAVAIATEHPRWNMQGRSDAHPDGKCNDIHRAPWLDYEQDVWSRHRDLVEDERRLIGQIRRVRMGLAGVRAEVDAIKSGFVLDDQEIA